MDGKRFSSLIYDLYIMYRFYIALPFVITVGCLHHHQYLLKYNKHVIFHILWANFQLKTAFQWTMRMDGTELVFYRWHYTWTTDITFWRNSFDSQNDINLYKQINSSILHGLPKICWSTLLVEKTTVYISLKKLSNWMHWSKCERNIADKIKILT